MNAGQTAPSDPPGTYRKMVLLEELINKKIRMIHFF